MEILSDPTPDMLAVPRFDDGAIDMRELLRRLAEQVVNAVMDAEGGAWSPDLSKLMSTITSTGKMSPRVPDGPRGRSANCGNGLSAQCVRLRSEINQILVCEAIIY